MAERKLAATITIGGAVASSLGKAFSSVTDRTKGLGKELKAISLQTKELEKMIKTLKAAGKSTADLEKQLGQLHRRQATLRGRQGRLSAISGMLSDGPGLQFGPVASRGIAALASSSRFGPATVSTLTAIGGAAPYVAATAASVAAVAAAAVAAGAAVTALGKSVADFIDGTADMADSLGVSTNNLLGLQYAAGQSGIDADKLNEKLAKLTLSLESAKDGTGDTAKALSTLGLSYEELSLLNPEGQVLALAEAFKTYNGNVPKVSLANAFFGKGSARFVNMLNEGRDGLQRMMGDARSVGYSISGEQEKAAAKFDAAWAKATMSFKSVWLEIGSAILPALTSALNSVTKWFRDPENRKLVAEYGESLGKVVKVLGDELPIILNLMGKFAWLTTKIMDGFVAIANASTKIGETIGGFFYDQTGGSKPAQPNYLGSSSGFMPMSPVRFGQSVTGATSTTPTPAGAKPAAAPQAKPAAGAGLGPTYNFTINGATGSNTYELMEQVRRHLRDTQPQHVGSY